MKKWILLTTVVLFTSATSTGQNPGPYRQQIEQRIESQRIAFITERLRLTPEEAQMFWPVYNAYREREDSLKEEKRPEKVLEDMSEEEAAEYVEKFLEVDMKMVDLKREFLNNLKEVLPAKKIILLEQAERLFKERLLNYMNQQRNRMNQNRPGKF